jgi:hypothetical protein
MFKAMMLTEATAKIQEKEVTEMQKGKIKLQRARKRKCRAIEKEHN